MLIGTELSNCMANGLPEPVPSRACAHLPGMEPERRVKLSVEFVVPGEPRAKGRAALASRAARRVSMRNLREFRFSKHDLRHTRSCHPERQRGAFLVALKDPSLRSG